MIIYFCFVLIDLIEGYKNHKKYFILVIFILEKSLRRACRLIKLFF